MEMIGRFAALTLEQLQSLIDETTHSINFLSDKETSAGWQKKLISLSQ